MSVTIHLEDFQSWSEIFEEIEKQRKMKLFNIIQPNPSAIHDREKKRKSFLRPVQEGRRISFGGANKSSHKPAGIQPIARSTSSPCCAISDGINPYNLHNDSRFTEAAKKLSKEKMALLYEDIVKPVDVYSILIEKRKETEMTYRKWTLKWIQTPLFMIEDFLSLYLLVEFKSSNLKIMQWMSSM